MLDNSYLIMGLDGLSHAHEHRYFEDGHLATSVIAAYYLCHENQLIEHTQNVIKARIDSELRNDVLFRPAPPETADTALLEQLLDSLSSGINDLRQVGHNIIFGAAALKAFRECPEAITPCRVDGICKLLDAFQTTQNVPVAKDDGVPEVTDEDALIGFIFNEYLHSVSLYAGYGQGWAGHLLTIGHAVIELSRLGYPDLAACAHNAYRMYIETMRRGPKATDRHIPDHPVSPLTPLDADYWKRRKSLRSGLGHAFKYAYSFYNLFSKLRDPILRDRCLAESHKIF